MIGALSSRGFRPLIGRKGHSSDRDDLFFNEETQGSEGQADLNNPLQKHPPSNEISLPSTLYTTPVGGSITAYLHKWHSITKDKWVLYIVAHGYSLLFKQSPPHLPPTKDNPSHLSLLRKEALALLRKNAIEKVPPARRGQGVYSRYFLVAKMGREGVFRPILDLRLLNKYIRKQKFRMLALHQIFPQLHQGDWMCSIDLQDAYFHIPIAPKHQKFLRFRVALQHYQFRVLPFGLKSAPRVFSKCMAVVAAHLRRQRIYIYPYLDDWLLKASSPEQARSHQDIVLGVCEALGLQVNYQKSTLTPTQNLHYLGAIISTELQKVYPSEERLSSINKKCQDLLRASAPTARQVTSLLGSMASCIFIVPNARLHMRPLQEALETNWSQRTGRWEDTVRLPEVALQSLRWWMHRPHLSVGAPFHQVLPSDTLVTDASLQGWGAHLGPFQAQGLWSDKEKQYHINLLELRAVHLALKSFIPLIQGKTLLIQTDNTTTMYYLNKQGGTRSLPLSRESQAIWHWLLARGM
ncbi:hypothetical protein NDU88_000300 [Pleurodeles waltl]|uniref:ribonuclease H n=1 Tax=Pleurodeles waltl TaxID=8319 RepID=A0AAV7P2F1_PLEWA|nr:hypothetical protein NDU88_000300 [Pleurodeles waltl]